MADTADQLAHIIRDLINDAVANGMGMGNLDRPDMTAQQLFEYLHYEQDLPVTRRLIHYAVMRARTGYGYSASARWSFCCMCARHNETGDASSPNRTISRRQLVGALQLRSVNYGF